MSANKPITAMNERGSISSADGRAGSDDPESDASEPVAPAEGRCLQHRHAQGDEAEGQHDEPGHELTVEDALASLPHQGERGLALGGCAGSVIQIREREVRGMREGADRQHGQAKDAERAPEQCRREARPAEGPIEGEEVGHPQHEDDQVQAVLDACGRLGCRGTC